MVSDQQLRSFWDLGCLPVGQVSGPEEVAQLSRIADVLLRGHRDLSLPEDHLERASATGSTRGHVRVALHLCHRIDAFRRHAMDGRSARIAASLLGEPVVALTSLLFNKPAGFGLELSWHQDLPYYPYLGDDDLITSWMALDEVGPRNGAVEYMPASHRVKIPHRSTGGQQALDILDSAVPRHAPKSFVLRPGDAVMHHGL